MTVDTRLVDRVHDRLWRRDEAALDPNTLSERATVVIREIEPLVSQRALEQTLDELDARMRGLGPLQPLADDVDVSEIMVNADGRVWVERSGALAATALRLGVDEREQLARRLAASAGRRIDVRRPAVDVRLDDGSRLHAILPPLAVDGPCLTIRRFRAEELGLEAFADQGEADRLRAAVAEGCSILVSGATSSGKTTLLNALGAHLPPGARVITIEDAAELRLPGDHVVRLETRADGAEVDAVEIADLLRHALRMRPDRIICGEVRGPEALALVQAMNTGHRGSMSTIHANSPADALRRLETLVLSADAGLPIEAIRRQIRSCLDLVVHVERDSTGGRRIGSVADVNGLDW